jgi:hypothetical protein
MRTNVKFLHLNETGVVTLKQGQDACLKQTRRRHQAPTRASSRAGSRRPPTFGESRRHQAPTRASSHARDRPRAARSSSRRHQAPTRASSRGSPSSPTSTASLSPAPSPDAGVVTVARLDDHALSKRVAGTKPRRGRRHLGAAGTSRLDAVTSPAPSPDAGVVTVQPVSFAESTTCVSGFERLLCQRPFLCSPFADISATDGASDPPPPRVTPPLASKFMSWL